MQNAIVCSAAILDDARLAEIVAMIFSRSQNSKRRKLSEQARIKKAAQQRVWNAANVERKRANDRRWAEKHQAQYMRLYRERKRVA